MHAGKKNDYPWLMTWSTDNGDDDDHDEYQLFTFT